MQHIPVFIICQCGARIQWGRFDHHVSEESKADAKREINRLIVEALQPRDFNPGGDGYPRDLDPLTNKPRDK